MKNKPFLFLENLLFENISINQFKNDVGEIIIYELEKYFGIDNNKEIKQNLAELYSFFSTVINKIIVNVENKTNNRIYNIKDKTINKELIQNIQDYGFELIINKIKQEADPTQDKRYTKWIINSLYNKQLIEDFPKLKEYLIAYDKGKKQLGQKEKNIFNYKNGTELFKMLIDTKIISKEAGFDSKNLSDFIESKDIEFIGETENFVIYSPLTTKGSCFLGKNTEWCTATYDPDDKRNMFPYYNMRGEIYVIINKITKERYQFHDESSQYMDENDAPTELYKNQEINEFFVANGIWRANDEYLESINYDISNKKLKISKNVSINLFNKEVSSEINNTELNEGYLFFVNKTINNSKLKLHTLNCKNCELNNNLLDSNFQKFVGGSFNNCKFQLINNILEIERGFINNCIMEIGNYNGTGLLPNNMLNLDKQTNLQETLIIKNTDESIKHIIDEEKFNFIKSRIKLDIININHILMLLED